jgi:hypothetical protein
MEKHLITELVDKDPAVAYDIIQNLTNHMRVNPNFAQRAKAAPATNKEMEIEVNVYVIDGLRHLMDFHKTSGTITLK